MVESNAIRELVGALSPDDEKKKSDTYSAVVSHIDEEGTVWVILAGSDKETPTASTSTEVKKGDSVTVQWRNNKLYIGGNYSNPSAGVGTVMPSVDFVTELIDKDITVNSINAATGYIGELTSDHITAGDISASSGYIKELKADDIEAEDIIADHATIESLDTNYAHITNGVIDNAKIGHADVNGLNANYAQINAANVTDLSAQNAWVNKIMVQTGLLAHEGTVFTLDAIQVNAANITAGTIDVNRLIVTVDGEKYLVEIDPTTHQPSYEKLDGNIVEPRTITADKIVAHDITVQEITTENLVGTNGWINLNQGKFFYGNGANYASSTNAIDWNGTTLKIKGDIGDSVVFNNYSTTTEMNTAIGNAVDGIEVGGRNLLLGTATPKSATMTSAENAQLNPYSMVKSYAELGFKVGDYVTVSFDWTITNATNGGTIKVGTNNTPWEYFGTVITTAAGSSSGHISKSYEVTSALASSAGNNIRFRLDNENGATFGVSNCKLERGNKATDWTPAPEDVQAEIDAKKSIHTLDSSYNTTYQQLLTWTAPTYTGGFSVTSTAGVKVGDTCRIKATVSDMNNAVVYMVVTVNAVASSTSINATGCGLDTTVIDGGHILTNSITANQIKARSIGASKLLVTDDTNLITVTELDANSLQNEMGTPRIENGYLIKNTATQAELGLTPRQISNFKQNDEIYYEFRIKAAAEGAIRFGIWGYDASGAYISGSFVGNTITATTSEQFVSGYIKLTPAVWTDTVKKYTIGINDDKTTKSQLYVRQAVARRKSAGELIVNGSITTDKLDAYAVTIGKINQTDAASMLNSNISVGGRNLVWDTGWNNVANRWATWGSPTTREIVTSKGKKWLHIKTSGTSFQGYSQNESKRNGVGEIKGGDVVVVSYTAYASAANTTATVGIHWRNDSGSIVEQNWYTGTFGTTPTRYVSTPTTVPSGATCFNIMVGDNTTAVKDIWINEVQVEFGNKATAWHPAPEDTAATATNYITHIDNNGIRVHPSSTENNSVVINADGMEVFKGGTGSANSVASYGDTVRIGKIANSYARTAINTGGMQVIQRNSSGTDVTMANIGYGSGAAESGTSTAPYYSLGVRTGNIGNYSVAEGSSATASGYCSHAEGIGTRATGKYAHAECSNTGATGEASHAEGYRSEASGNYSHAGGCWTKATGESQTTIGKYNATDTTSLFIIGKGTADGSRSNALTVSNTGALAVGDAANTFAETVYEYSCTLSAGGFDTGDNVSITKSGYYPVAVSGWDASTRYFCLTRCVLTSRAKGSGALSFMLYNPSSSSRAGTIKIYVMWLKMT